MVPKYKMRDPLFRSKVLMFILKYIFFIVAESYPTSPQYPRYKKEIFAYFLKDQKLKLEVQPMYVPLYFQSNYWLGENSVGGVEASEIKHLNDFKTSKNFSEKPTLRNY